MCKIKIKKYFFELCEKEDKQIEVGMVGNIISIRE